MACMINTVCPLSAFPPRSTSSINYFYFTISRLEVKNMVESRFFSSSKYNYSKSSVIVTGKRR